MAIFLNIIIFGVGLFTNNSELIWLSVISGVLCVLGFKANDGDK
jgi:hypothetical protein